MRTVTLYDWAGSARNIIEKEFGNYGAWDTESSNSFIVDLKNLKLSRARDMIFLLNFYGLNVIVPHDFNFSHTLYVDTRMFQQR